MTRTFLTNAGASIAALTLVACPKPIKPPIADGTGPSNVAVGAKHRHT